MKGFIQNIETLTNKNTNFRKVLYTSKNSQLVLMSLLPKEEIGLEKHHLDQFIKIESGRGLVILDRIETSIEAGFGIVIPSGC
jgi:mannose-6-phosphate isomerase-like protein (cupin superfamily)